MADFPPIIYLSSLGSRGFKIRGEAADDHAGGSVSRAGDVNGDGFEDFIIGARLNDGGDSEAGAAYLIFGKAGGYPAVDLAGLTAADGFKIQGDTASGYAGVSVSAAGDVNGDGYDDMIVGTRRDAAAAYVIFGKASGFTAIDLGSLAPSDGFRILRAAGYDDAGRSVSSAGDVNGDGFDDVIVGARYDGSGGANSGAAYVVFGKASGFTSIDLAVLGAADGFKIQGAAAQDQAGWSVSSAGDVNGDGFGDVIVAARLNDSGGTDAGAAYVIFGKAAGFGTVDLAALAPAQGFKIQGDANGDLSGYSVSSAGDVNGDGYDDMIVGAPFNDSGGINAGAAYLVFGKAGGFTTIDLAGLTSSDGFKIQGGVYNAGISVSSAGDVNGDGFDDLIVGDLDDGGGTVAGAAYVIFGKASGFASVDLDNLAPDAGFKIQGAATRDFAGFSVSAAGDMDGDGFGDILVGAPGADSYTGAAYVVYGAAPTAAVTRIGAAADQTIRGGAFNDVLDGLGGDDWLFGAGGNDSLAGGQGDDLLDGGLGADQLAGGAGDDMYLVDDAGDTLTEAANEGVDHVQSSVSYALADNLETLTLTGTAAIDGTGNALDNVITGNGANNVIDGGLGADAMTGGLGNDVYYVDNAGDAVTELAGEGTDEIRTSLATFSLQALANVENLTATSNVNHDFRGNSGNNVLTGGAGHDTFRLQDGGTDSAIGGGGNDFFLLGATLTSADAIDGGAGTDQVAIQGNYTLTFGSGLVNIESLIPLPGNDVRFGDSGTNFYDYDLTAVDANLSAGQRLTVDANRLRVGEDFTFNGSAESDGNFFLVGGNGVDTFTGGAQSDTFLFGENGQFGASDTVNGGPGGTNDQLGLRGNYTVTFGAGQLIGIESIALVSAQDTRFGALGSAFNYNLTMNDGNVGAGQLMTVDGAPLRPAETLTFNGSLESDGSYRVAGGAGADTITGGQQGDILIGRAGGDMLRGGAGNDLFRIDATGESNAAGRDQILDFANGDRIDLSRMDAIAGTPANEAFTFIGSAAFGNHAGELRFENQSGNIWLIQGDTDGNGIADFEVSVTIDDLHPITAADFIL